VVVQKRRPAAAPLKAPSGMSKRPAAPEPSAQAPATKGLDALDRDRAASLADEGGAAGAQVEGPRATLEEEAAMRQAIPIPRPVRPVPPEGDEPERPQERRLPGKDQITPAFDDSDETPVIPARLQPAARGRSAK
jgi:hypothetical protein